MSKIYVVGIGPGEESQTTPRAAAAMAASQVLVGYTVYIDLVRDRYPDKELVATPMTTEVDRCRACLALALEGKTVAMLCSGDPGVYGMAGLIFQQCREHPEVEIEVIPGVTAATAGAALLGAPLIHDFAVVSLSDALTPWEMIEKRLTAAAQADFVLCIYNPASRRRKDTLTRACDLLLQYRPGDTVCGLARCIGREGESARLCTLAELREEPADMFTTVYVGNSATQNLGGKMVTPRGYEQKAAFDAPGPGADRE